MRYKTSISQSILAILKAVMIRSPFGAMNFIDSRQYFLFNIN